MENEEIKKPTTKKPKPKKVETVEETEEYNPLEGIEVNVVNEVVEVVEEIAEIIIPAPEVFEEPAITEEPYVKTKEEELIDIARQIQQKVYEVRQLTDREIYESYVSEGRPFIIFFQQRLVFDSTLSDKKVLKFLEEGFQIHGRIYNYNGIRFKFKK